MGGRRPLRRTWAHAGGRRHTTLEEADRGEYVNSRTARLDAGSQHSTGAQSALRSQDSAGRINTRSTRVLNECHWRGDLSRPGGRRAATGLAESVPERQSACGHLSALTQLRRSALASGRAALACPLPTHPRAAFFRWLPFPSSGRSTCRAVPGIPAERTPSLIAEPIWNSTRRGPVRRERPTARWAGAGGRCGWSRAARAAAGDCRGVVMDLAGRRSA